MEAPVTIERLSYGNAGIGHTGAGKTLFVEDAVPGDTVLVQIDEEKQRYASAHITEIVESSPHRVQPPCPYVGECGGCPWQQVAYEAQLEAKRDNVVSALVRTAHLSEAHAQEVVSPCLADGRGFGYRNKIEFGAAFTEGKGFDLGFRKSSSHAFVTPDRCMIAHKEIERSAKALKGSLRFLQGKGDLGIFRVGIRHSTRTGDLELALWTKPGSFPRSLAARTLRDSFKASSIVRVVAEEGKARAVKQVEALYGKGSWEERLGPARYKTSAPSFFQVNTEQAEKLVDLVIEKLDLETGAVVADLYAGGGTFSIPLALTGCEVIAVESLASSVRDLRRNAESNGVSLEVIGGDSARELPELGFLDALVVDPPRAGLAEGVAASIAATGPNKLAYVSCDPSTWARDVVRLDESGYSLREAVPVDLFPQSYHCEIVSLFERRGGLS